MRQIVGSYLLLSHKFNIFSPSLTLSYQGCSKNCDSKFFQVRNPFNFKWIEQILSEINSQILFYFYLMIYIMSHFV